MIASATRFVLATCVVVVLGAAPAWACRGTHEYPEAALKLASADLPEADKATLQKRLDEGLALHERGHKENNRELRIESLKILDDIKAKLAK